MANEASGEATTPEQRCILKVLEFIRVHERFPSAEELGIDHTKSDFHAWDALFKKGFLRDDSGYVVLLLAGLLKYGGAEAIAEHDRFEHLLPFFQTAYQRDPQKRWTVNELAKLGGMAPHDVAMVLTFYALGWGPVFWSGLVAGGKGGFVEAISFSSDVLDEQKITLEIKRLVEEEEFEAVQLSELQVSGYRALEGFEAKFTPLTVIIGANASGKSSLFDFLAFVSFAAGMHLPPEVDPRSVGKTLFHLGAPERIEWRMRLEREDALPLQYSVKLNGPLVLPDQMREGPRTGERAPTWRRQSGQWPMRRSSRC